jgi:hypothetical protein
VSRSDGAMPACAWTDAGDLIESRLKRGLAPFLPVKRYGESVRFVANALYEKQRLESLGRTMETGLSGKKSSSFSFARATIGCSVQPASCKPAREALS